MKTEKAMVVMNLWRAGNWSQPKTALDDLHGQRSYMRIASGGGQYADRADAVAACGEAEVTTAEAEAEMMLGVRQVGRAPTGELIWRRIRS